MLAGNDRFVTGQRLHPNQDAERRAALVHAQRPFAVVFGCSDSRLAAEIIFDRGLGDLFVVRTAGHVVGPEVLASIEYGVCVLGVPLVVVLGHDSCGAVQATFDAVTGIAPAPPGLRPIVDRIAPSLPVGPASVDLDAVDLDAVDLDAVDLDAVDLDAVSATHVRRTVEQIVGAGAPANGRTPARGIAQAVRSGACGVVGLTYRLAEGRVSLVAQAGTE